MRLRSTGTGYTTSVLGNGGVWKVVPPGAGGTGFGGQRPWGGGPGLAGAGLGLDGGRWPEQPREPSFATSTGPSWRSVDVVWSSTTALVSQVSVAFNNANWACLFHELPHLVFADEGQVVRVYRLDPAAGGWAEWWNSTDGGAAPGYAPASWPSLAANDEDDRLLVCYVGSSGSLVTVEFTSSGSGTITEHDSGGTVDNPVTNPAAAVVRGAFISYARLGDIYVLQEGTGRALNGWADPERNEGLGSGYVAEFPSVAWAYRDVGGNYDDYRVIVLACQSTDASSQKIYISADFWTRSLPESSFRQQGLCLDAVTGRDPCCWASPDGLFYLAWTWDLEAGANDIYSAYSAQPEGSYDWSRGGWVAGDWTAAGILTIADVSKQEGNNFANGAATAEHALAVWENGPMGSGVKNRKIDSAWGPAEFAEIDGAYNASDVGEEEQGQLPCIILTDDGSSVDVHLFFVAGQGSGQPASIRYRYGRLA